MLVNLKKKLTYNLPVDDRILIKVYLLIFGIFLAKLFPDLTNLHRGWFLAFVIIAKTYLTRKVGKQQKSII